MNQSKISRRQVELPHGRVECPAFLPDGTQAVVRAADAADLERVGIQALQTNVFHLMQRPGTTTIEALGGLHSLMGWRRPITTDSGGFQIYSLIRQNPKHGSITDNGASFKAPSLSRNVRLTPEKSIQLQFKYGSDLLFCLDDCTHVDEDDAVQRSSVERTIAWAGRCKAEYEKLVEAKGLAPSQRPHLYAVIQGGGDKALRQECAEKLMQIGFDGYGYGGWPLDSDGNLLVDLLGYTRNLIPADIPMHALGIGHPESVRTCAHLGYELFDSVMPTRDARHGRLYRFEADPAAGLPPEHWYSFVHLKDQRYLKDSSPVSEVCDCLLCQRYSRGYLHHLLQVDRSAYERLATIHNLRFMAQLMSSLRRAP
ncbi:MAG: tRNA guanosine(34) transglycosylase Tgt [Anaerolineales bacterium]